MLNKEECEQALMNICSSNSRIEDRKIFKDLIDEHFKLVEKYNTLLTRFNALENPQPYKFEDLKPNLWVWDKSKQRCLKIIERTSDCLGSALIKYCNGYDNQEIYYHDEFKENRFYPVQMANARCE